LPQFIATDILDPDHLPLTFSILGPGRTREDLDPFEKLRDWKLFQSVASELISSNIDIRFSNEAHKAALDFSASVASAYMIPTRKTTILDRNYVMHGLGYLLKHEIWLRKIMQETTDPACKAAVKCFTKNIRKMVRK
jgi:hypothetical protein